MTYSEKLANTCTYTNWQNDAIYVNQFKLSILYICSTSAAAPSDIIKGLLHFSLFSSTLKPAPAIPKSWNIMLSEILNNTARSETLAQMHRFSSFYSASS